MTIDDKMRKKNFNMVLTEKQQKYQHYYPQKKDKYEYLTGEEILPSVQSRVIEQAKFPYSSLEKAFEKQTKTGRKQGRKTSLRHRSKNIGHFIIKNIFN